MHMCLCPVWFHLYVLSPFSTPRTDRLFSFCSTNSKWVSLPQQHNASQYDPNRSEQHQCYCFTVFQEQRNYPDTSICWWRSWKWILLSPRTSTDTWLICPLRQHGAILRDVYTVFSRKKIRFVKWFLKVKLGCWLFSFFHGVSPIHVSCKSHRGNIPIQELYLLC